MAALQLRIMRTADMRIADSRIHAESAIRNLDAIRNPRSEIQRPSGAGRRAGGDLLQGGGAGQGQDRDGELVAIGGRARRRRWP